METMPYEFSNSRIEWKSWFRTCCDTFHNDLHRTLKADYILANPSFNISDWGGGKLTDAVRWKFGTPPEGNANYAWLHHMGEMMNEVY